MAPNFDLIDIPWAKFKSDDWMLSKEATLKKIAAIKLKFEGGAGTTGDFLIQQVGSLGQCQLMPLCKRQ